jgi:hypothetical protein
MRRFFGRHLYRQLHRHDAARRAGADRAASA